MWKFSLTFLLNHYWMGHHKNAKDFLQCAVMQLVMCEVVGIFYELRHGTSLQLVSILTIFLYTH